MAYILIGIVLIVTSAGCGPTIPNGLTGEDLQACDDVAAKTIKIFDDYFKLQEDYKAGPTIPLRAGKAEITSPADGSALPFGPVMITFKQPPVQPGVDHRRNFQVWVRPIYSNPNNIIGNPYEVVLAYPTELAISWTPPSAGKYILMVLYRNLETTGEDITNVQMGELLEVEQIAHGPFSMAYVCIRIDPPKPGTVSSQPVKIMPVDSIATRTSTVTSTVTMIPAATLIPSSTFTTVPSLTPTVIKTLIPTKPSATITNRPVQASSTPTNVPPVDCSQYTEKDPCNRDLACIWEPHLSDPGGDCKNK